MGLLNMNIVLYHANCFDGFCAAWVAWGNLNIKTKFLPVQYGQGLPESFFNELNSNDNVYILDFSYKAEVLRRIIDKCNHLVVLDHHKSAKKDLENFSHPNAYICFNMEKSGGRLTWEFFQKKNKPNWLVLYTEDRDLWKWELPNSKAINAYLRSYPMDFWWWKTVSGIKDKNYIITEGEAILRAEQKIVDTQASFATDFNIGGHQARIVNATTLISETAGKLAEEAPIGMTWFQRADGKFIYSLRVRQDIDVDVSEIAKTYGGGGHRKAAGFESLELIH